MNLTGDIAAAAVALRDVLEREPLPALFDRATAVVAIIENIAAEVRRLLSVPEAVPERDPELEDVLAAIGVRLGAIEPLAGPERDEAYGALERFANAYALAFYHEIRQLDDLLRVPQETRKVR